MRRIAILCFSLFFLFFLNVSYSPTSTLIPFSCYDSDGDCDVERIKQKDNIYELVDLLFYPYGWLVVEGFKDSIPEENEIDLVSFNIFWFTDLGEGASNIYIEYWNGSQWLYCAGPFGERGELTHTSCNAFLTKNQIQNLKVRVRGEDIDGFPMAFIYIDRIFVSVNYTIGSPYLEVSLRFPIPDKINNVAQNSTFLVNATVYCRDGDCGEVFGILLYNSTTEAPDTPVSTIYGEKPFFIQEENSSSFKSCLKNPLKKDDYCFLRWVVNASGDLNTYWKIAVLFNSTNPDVSQNITRSATIFITFCTIDFTLGWEVLDFGTVLPNTYANPAVGNSNNTYKIFLGQSSCNLNLYIRGQNLIGKNRGNLIRIENISVSNSTNKFSTSFRIKEENQLLFYNISSGEYYTYYWMDLPPIYADVYIGEIYVVGVKNEDEV
ncbi:MAG: hypothetical protein RMJ18_02195 [Candidatus Aenigmarchaeota archaeon]|nr:hypothetical protein [Candidatus Aenigmarchaeota archaeon]MDW8160205.1 hypothetical protein [Candidatus Aenigmarchaeota archaeon]